MLVTHDAAFDIRQPSARSVPPSNLSLLGLVRHLAACEHYWFRRVLAGQDVPRLYRTAEGDGDDFDGAVPDPAVVGESSVSVREVLVHLIEE